MLLVQTKWAVSTTGTQVREEAQHKHSATTTSSSRSIHALTHLLGPPSTVALLLPHTHSTPCQECPACGSRQSCRQQQPPQPQCRQPRLPQPCWQQLTSGLLRCGGCGRRGSALLLLWVSGPLCHRPSCNPGPTCLHTHSGLPAGTVGTWLLQHPTEVGKAHQAGRTHSAGQCRTGQDRRA